jgi:hypothetical protein
MLQDQPTTLCPRALMCDCTYTPGSQEAAESCSPAVVNHARPPSCPGSATATSTSCVTSSAWCAAAGERLSCAISGGVKGWCHAAAAGVLTARYAAIAHRQRLPHHSCCCCWCWCWCCCGHMGTTRSQARLIGSPKAPTGLQATDQRRWVAPLLAGLYADHIILQLQVLPISSYYASCSCALRPLLLSCLVTVGPQETQAG